ncbi:toll/interleukin-1 receptor domain-containing protein [uncultured Algoriphagus sp.]|uniref:toll/interleukin-1 receptor domain-containing protein n=1 Tax=uncultured Algoriphagus sp. TaxID=417365 RepID=UPI002586344D|nr:toll/interleukin-1 receptor domain-containing protein [uncultured Algoriphagus sp.]
MNKLVEELSAFNHPETYHREFWEWRQKAMRRLSLIFGNPSLQLNHFISTKYVKPSLSMYNAYYGDPDLEKKQLKEITERFANLLSSLAEEIPDESEPTSGPNPKEVVKNVFISHSSKDHLLAKEVTILLEAMGVPSSQIFNSSMAGYGVKPGEKWPESLHSAMSSDGVVISLISSDYNKSAVCLCEMGAAWILAKTYYPIVIPPLTFRKIKGVLPTIHGIEITNSLWWSELKERLEQIFSLTPIPVAIWEGKKKDILERIEKLLPEK